MIIHTVGMAGFLADIIALGLSRFKDLQYRILGTGARVAIRQGWWR